MSATDFLADMETEATNWLVAQVNGALPDALNLTVDPTNGVSITLTVPNAPVVTLSDLTWAGGSPSGELKLAVTAGHDASLDLFGGLNVALTAFDLKLNPGLAATISGTLDVPFFSGSDKVNVDISVKSDGSLSVTLSAQQNNATPDGLPQLSYTFGLATVTITLSSLTVSETNGNWSVSLAGSLDIETADLQWPTFDLKGLSVDARGKVSLEGGWINLPSQTALSFYGFTVALHQLGFGSDASGDWIGFNGDIQLVEGISLGGSVQGMKLNLGTGTVSFTGVGIDMEIPGVIAFNGAVDHISLQSGDDPTTYGLPAGFPVPADVFAGHVDVTIEAAGDLEVDGSFVVAHVTQKDGSVTTAFFLALDLELPVGIPLFLDVSLYGLSGLFATNLAPVDPTLSGDTWWDWYKYDSRDAVIDKSGTEYSATDEQKWLNPVPGAFALGAGATIGTQDDGFTASAAIAFMILLPGPIIAFVGKADILSTRINGASGDANFQAMATYDGTTETFDMVVQAQYSIPVVLDIEATAELYADKTGVWFLALGKPPHEQRVRARIFDLFETDAYFVVSNTGLMTGTWTGYKNSWSFGPLSASLDAYLATLAAIQWKPLQIAAGIELHGEVHLSAFGIGVGITADALLEGTAPNPFWVYGSLQVELDLPWPLPNVGATISLSWGGNDGTVPPAPLALSAVNAVLVDHGTSDRYELLAHRGTPVNAASPGDTVVYDSAAPGILAASPPGYWTAKDPNVANDYASIAPDLDPSTLGWASVVPQDSHFTLAFAHQTTDYVGFANETAPVPADPVTVSTPGIVGADDLSNLNPNPPAVQWLIEHALLEVALYAYDADAATWQLASASPQGAAPLDLPGVWLAHAPGESAAKPNTALKIVPYTLRRGSFESAAWGDTLETFGTHFSDQGLQFDCGPGIAPVSVSAPSQSIPAGLEFRSSVAGAGAAVTITFATTVTLNAIEVLTVGGGEFPYSAATFTAGGVVLNPANLSQDPSTNIFTLSFDSTTPPVTQIEMTVLGEPTFLFGIAYQTPDVKLPILPAAPALYALKVVTRIGAGRVDGNGNAAFAPLPDANPVIEFAYFQTASGPGVGTIDAPSAPQSPFVRPADPNLGDAAPPAPKSFPTAGRLNDLATYFQWSWPTDGDLYAYYGYDFSAEFDETYVVELYEALSLGGEDFAIARERSIPLHFRCVDRNNAHTFSIPVATQVASLPQQSALVAALVVPPYPQTIAPPADSPVVPYDPVVFGRASLQIREAMSGRRLILRSDDAATRTVLQSAARAVSGTALTGSLGGSLALNPGLGTGLQHVIAELEAAAAARAAWFQRLAPRTRYRLDIVPGPAGVALGRFGNYTYPSYPAIAQAPDAIGAYAALLAYFAGEDKLTSLRRIEFATSRYATFSAHVANAVAQTQAASGATPIRRYGAQVDPQVWLANAANGDGTRTAAQSAYEAARTALAQVAATFDPLHDALLPGTAPPAANSNGQGALKLQRAATGAAWDAFAAATTASFDGLVSALGWPQFADARHAPLPPDTELSVFTTNADTDVVALLLESPEPILWRRLWAWTTLQPRGLLSEPLAGTTVLWNADGTRALLVPQGRVVGAYALSMRFQGDIGPEAPCISLDAVNVDEGVTFAPLVFVPLRIWRQPARDVPLG